jgi:3-mercaptopyruvate sulfurtransferase SseA
LTSARATRILNKVFCAGRVGVKSVRRLFDGIGRGSNEVSAMNNEATPALIHCGWLAERLGSADLVVLDATFFLPAQNRSAAGEYLAGHIPGAAFFDIDAVADPDSPLPHMLPSPQQFAEAVGRLGIANTTQVVVYDANTFMASARVWWTFRVFGHDRVSVLDGGLVRWKALGHAVETEAAHRPPVRPFAAGFRPELAHQPFPTRVDGNRGNPLPAPGGSGGFAAPTRV